MIQLFLYLMFILIINLFNLSIYLMYKKIMIFIEFEFLKLSSIKLEYLILMDWLSMFFSLIVLMISFSVIIYSIEYMSGDYNINRFIFLVMLFVMFMIFMIISPNMVSILLGWDGLGLISYCLVIYYQNESSFNSGMVTVLTNRIGDSIILMLIGLMLINGSWNFMFYYQLNFLIMFLIMMASFTKSAQIPFSAWLPKAMAAPTPVSSLVHSSTLVTAGVYLLIRFNYLMKLNLKLMNFMMFISIMTLFMSGLCANLEFDFKKIIAFSTLSQLGVMIFCLSMGFIEISFFHLLTHAMFKCMLFMCAGIIIHNMILNQDIRYISMIFKNMPLVSMVFNCSTFSLCGIPFMSGFFSKDKILEMFMMNYFNKFMFMIMFFSMGLTISYSCRLMFYSFIMIPCLNIFCKFKSLKSLMFYSMMILFFMTIFMGFMLNWMIFSSKNLIFLSKELKLIIYMFLMGGILIGVNLLWISIKLKNLILMKNYFFFFINMWFLFIIYNMKMFEIMNFFKKKFFLIDLKWNEYLISFLIYSYLKKDFYMDLYNKNFYFILIIILYFFLMILY
uniref:NADH-ubiquinone oxidoreductase chain 5 n=1 Tax=Diadegma semiclausum TaxID=208481 RepID=C4N025_DIASM|nr:NADH dehydrogenase subunit 5 [Diadegma semiclausum]ACF35063.1 NADH dehydrogenase subunit 5 [Diadegma semiclausum]